MKKRLLSILLMCCMVLTLLPTTAFAEESTETPPCSCETACTAESMNAGCPMCGAEDALPENCGKYVKPADDAAVQPEGEVSDPQPETALTALIGGSETVTEVSTADDLTAAIADSNVSTVRLAGDISISSSLTVTRTVTLDLNGKVLRMVNNENDPVIEVKKGKSSFDIGNLTLTDSAPDAEHKFTPNADGLWVLDEKNGTKTVNGGVITGGKYMGIWVDGYDKQNPTQKPAEADCAHLIMTGGNIVGCMTERNGGGVCAARHAYFTMTGGSIRGCVAKVSGGGVSLSWATVFDMGGSALIADCVSTGSTNSAGGGIDAYASSVTLSGNAAIRNCTAELGGGVYLNSTYLTMSGNASIIGCTATNGGGGIYTSGNTGDPTGNTVVFTMKDASSIVNCTALKGGGVFFMTSHGVMSLSGNAKIENCRAIEREGLSIPDVIGGGVLVVIGRLEISGGSITGCTAAKGGDSVFTDPSGGFTMTGGTVDGSIRLSYSVGNNTVYMDGLGTKESPYEISTADQLKLFRDIVNGANGQTQNTAACAVLMNDIVLNDGTFDANGTYTPGSSSKTAEEWTPIGKYTNDVNNIPYTGTFDGQGHTIKGLYVVNLSDVAVGMFGCLEGAAVRNLTVDGYVQGCDMVSGIAGDASANSTIENCRNNCRVVSEFVTGSSGSFLYVGGIVGSAKNTTIAGCVNTGVVEARGSYNNSYASNAAGIVCILDGNATVKNCYNTGEIKVTSDKLNAGTAAGIAGKDLDAHNTVSDCYNVGAVTVKYTGDRDSYIAMVGGIMGKIYYSDTTVSNCYSVGTLTSTTGTGTSYIGGVVGITNGTVGNCYYLDSTATKAVGNVGGTVDEATGPKTAAQLGNDTVLALLINNRGDSEHPWNSQCQYLAAAGKTLPVFKTQTGDAHTHDWSAWTSNGDGTHSRRCTCNAVETQNCSGGTASCTMKAVCEVCKAEYGDTNLNHHGDKLKHVEAKAATTREEGNIEYWHCEACGKYFSDNAATKEITQAETVIPKRQSSGSNYSYYTIKATAGTGGAISPSGNVSVRGGRDQTFTITPDQGYAVSDVKIDGESVGVVTSYSFENVRKAHTIAVSFATIKIFVDVPAGSYYEDAVDWAVENGITQGTDDTHFSPDGICTRAQAVTFLWRAAGSPEPETRAMPFTDVPVGSYYYDAVLWAVENGITKGTSDTTFSPNVTCSRAQIVAFLWRSEKSLAAGTANPFADVKSTAYYADAVAWAVANGVTNGTTSSTFSPDNGCTRAQIVTFLYRAFNK